MAAQLALRIPEAHTVTLGDEVNRLIEVGALETGALPHALQSGRITMGHFAEWRGRPLSVSERRRVEAYFRAVLRRRIVRGTDAIAGDARRRLVTRTIELDLVQAGWDPPRARLQAYEATGHTSGA